MPGLDRTAHAQHRQIRQPARIQVRIDQPCQLNLAAAIMGERQQLDR
jgi:hypothetical protein